MAPTFGNGGPLSHSHEAPWTKTSAARSFPRSRGLGRDDSSGGHVDGFRPSVRTARPHGRSFVHRYADALRRTDRLARSLAGTRAAGGDAPGGGAPRAHLVLTLRAAGTARGRPGRVAALLRALAPYDR